MSFWSSEKLNAAATGPSPDLISPFVPDRVRHGAYELSLGDQAYVTSATSENKLSLESGEWLSIPPGQFGLLVTAESVHIPKNAIGFISIRAGIKFRGLINVSGFHVDPGYKGKIKYSIYNAGSKPVLLSAKEPVFLLWLADLDRTTTDFYKKDGATGITTSDVMSIQGDMPSPAALKTELEKLQLRVNMLIAIGIAVLAGLFGPNLKEAANRVVDKVSSPSIERITEQPRVDIEGAAVKPLMKVENKAIKTNPQSMTPASKNASRPAEAPLPKEPRK